MTLDEAKEAKAKAEAAIDAALREFTDATGLRVDRVSIRSVTYREIGLGARTLLDDVQLEVSFP